MVVRLNAEIDVDIYLVDIGDERVDQLDVVDEMVGICQFGYTIFIIGPAVGRGKEG